DARAPRPARRAAGGACRRRFFRAPDRARGAADRIRGAASASGRTRGSDARGALAAASQPAGRRAAATSRREPKAARFRAHRRAGTGASGKAASPAVRAPLAARMRIVGGRLRGRALAAPRSTAIRPTADRLRETVFNVLVHAYDDPVTDARVLDLFAGTGALGLEALSRGAAFALFVDDGAEARA